MKRPVIRHDSEAGFVLTEAIAALSTAAIAAAALIVVLGSASSRSSEAGVRSLALREAEVLLLEAAQAPDLSELSRNGEFTSPELTWRRDVLDPDPALPGLQRVVVEVSWKNMQKQGATRLETYRTVPR